MFMIRWFIKKSFNCTTSAIIINFNKIQVKGLVQHFPNFRSTFNLSLVDGYISDSSLTRQVQRKRNPRRASLWYDDPEQLKAWTQSRQDRGLTSKSTWPRPCLLLLGVSGSHRENLIPVVHCPDIVGDL